MTTEPGSRPVPAAEGTGLPTTTRVEAFSDAVIAIAATLLVLELHLPEPGENVWATLAHEAPAFAAFTVSFLTILILWVNHHALFAAVAHVDRTLLFLNGLLLLGISFISYPTATLGRALQSGEYARSAAVLYALTFASTSACFAAIWAYLRARPALLATEPRVRVDVALRRSLVGPGLYLVSLLAALVTAPAALIVAAAAAAYFAATPRRRRTGR